MSDRGILASKTAIELARLTHDAEDRTDDLTFLAIQDEVERRPAAEREAYRLAWIAEIRNRARP